MSQQPIQIARAYMEEVWGGGNLGFLDQVCSADYVQHNPGVPEPVRGVEAAKQLVQSYRNGFEHLQVTVHDSFASGDRVVTRWSTFGRHTGDLFGIPATGRQATATGITIQRISDGKIAEEWIEINLLGVMQQLGAIPTSTTG